MFIKRGPRRKTQPKTAASTQNRAAQTSQRARQPAARPQNVAPKQTAAAPQKASPKKKSVLFGAKPKPKAAQPNTAVNGAARKEADRAVQRAQRERAAAASKPRRRRKGSLIVYYIIGLIIAVIVLIVLANTVLFNCDKVLVEGNVSYSHDEITAAAAIPMGENIFRIDTKDAEKRIVASLNYIDIAEVSRILPTGIKITVKEAEEWFCVKQGSGSATISRNGKIVSDKINPSLPLVNGYTVERLIVGEQLVSIGDGKQDIPSDILNAADVAGLGGFINEIDMADRFSIILKCDDDIIIKLGNVKDLDQKFEVANAILAENEGMTDITVSVVNPAVGYMHRNDSVIIPPIIEESTETSETGESSESSEA